MEVQTLVMSENELGNLAITTPDGETIPILDSSTLAIAAASNETETSEQLNPYSMITPNGELAIETITFNVAEVFGEETNALVNSRQLHFIQHPDGSLHPMFNSDNLEENKQAADNQEISEIIGEVVEQETNEINGENILVDVPSYEIHSTIDIERADSQHDLSVDSQDIQNELIKDSEVGNNDIGDEEATDAHDEIILSEESRHSEIINTQENDEDNSNTVVIDVSNPIELSQNSLIVVNGKKCVLQQNLETGQLIAYPIKEPEKAPKRRGRPRRSNTKTLEKITRKDKELVPNIETSSKLEEDFENPEKVEPSGEIGFVEKANEEGEIVKRSARKRKKTTLLAEYETSTMKFECSSDEEYTKDKDEAEDESMPSKRRAIRGRGRGGRLVVKKPPSQIYPEPGKRGRGRPRRNGIKPPEQPATQTFLIHTADGQAIMIKVPVSSLSPGKSLQNTAQDIADSLNARTQNFLPLAPKPPVNPIPPPTESNGINSQFTAEKLIDEELVGSEGELHQFSDNNTEQQVDTSYEKEEDTVEHATGTRQDESSQIDTIENSTTEASIITNDKEEENLVNATAYPLSVIPFRIGLRAAENDLEKLKCIKCNFQAYYEKQYQEHIATHPDDIQQCKCCEFMSFTKTELTEHYNEHHPKCICPVCNHTAAHPYVIKRHMYRHSDVSSTCEICGKTYRDHYILRMHIKNVHMPAEEFFDCPTCSKQFTRKAHLKRHIRTHDPNKPYKCPQCDYRGGERSDITKHKLIHEDPKYTCEVCLRTFRHIKNMELHVKRHNGQRDYKCGVCEFYGYTFTDIRKHIERKHADPKTILCGKCGQAFKTDQELQEHQSSDQCELFMLEQVLQEQEQMDDSSQPEDDLLDEDEESLVNTEENQDCAGIESITLTDESIAALNVIQEIDCHIVISGDLGEITAARLLDTDGDGNMLNNHELQETRLTLIAGETHLETQPLTILSSDGENKDFAIVTEDCKSSGNDTMDDNITTSFINFEVSNSNET